MDDVSQTAGEIEDAPPVPEDGEQASSVGEFDYELMAQNVHDVFEVELTEVKGQLATHSAFTACGFGIVAGLLLALLLHRVLNYG